MVTAFQIPRILQAYCNDQPELGLKGSTVRSLLNEVERAYPDLYRCLCNETGAVRQHLKLFLNDALLDERHGLDTRLKAGDVVSVFQAVSGG